MHNLKGLKHRRTVLQVLSLTHGENLHKMCPVDLEVSLSILKENQVHIEEIDESISKALSMGLSKRDYILKVNKLLRESKVNT